MKLFLKMLALFVLTFFVTVAFSFVTAWVVMLLWNWLMPIIFGITTITFWQSFGLMVLTSLLFSGVRYNYSEK